MDKARLLCSTSARLTDGLAITPGDDDGPAIGSRRRESAVEIVEAPRSRPAGSSFLIRPFRGMAAKAKGVSASPLSINTGALVGEELHQKARATDPLP